MLSLFARGASRAILGFAIIGAMPVAGFAQSADSEPRPWYDRIEFGKVRDFINLYFGDYNGWNWPTFNIADAALVGGIGVLLVLSFLHKHPKEAKAA